MHIEQHKRLTDILAVANSHTDEHAGTHHPVTEANRDSQICTICTDQQSYITLSSREYRRRCIRGAKSDVLHVAQDNVKQGTLAEVCQRCTG